MRRTSVGSKQFTPSLMALNMPFFTRKACAQRLQCPGLLNEEGSGLSAVKNLTASAAVTLTSTADLDCRDLDAVAPNDAASMASVDRDLDCEP